jgi:hypothetical protein
VGRAANDASDEKIEDDDTRSIFYQQGCSLVKLRA